MAVGPALLEAVRILAQKDQSNGIDRPTDSAFCQLGWASPIQGWAFDWLSADCATGTPAAVSARAKALP